MGKLQDDEVKLKMGLEADKAQQTIHELTKATEALRKQNIEHRKEITRLAAAEGDHSAEIKRLNETIQANTREIETNKRSIQKEEEQIDLSCKTAAQLGRELKKLKHDLANTSKATNPGRYRELEQGIRRTERAYAEATKSTRGFMTSLLSLEKMGTAIKGFFMGLAMVIATQVVGAFKSLASTIMDFEKANSKLAGVLGTSLEGIKKLTEQAKFLGRTTTATASQVTQLQTELAKLGFTQDVIEKLTPSVLKFSKAVDTDLGSAAAFAGAAMRIFDKDASEAESVLATLAVSTTKSALDFSKLQASLATVGPVANNFGFTIEETVALLGQLSNAGFDASSAATATRNILLNLADSNGELAQALGGPVTNLDQLVDGLKKLNAEGIDLGKALELTDKRSVSAFNTFLNGADNIKALRDSITDCTADFNGMAKTMADNAAGGYAGFQSAVEGLILKFYDFREVLKTLFEWATEFVNWIGSIVDAFSPLGSIIGFTAKCFGEVVSAVATLVGQFSKLFTQTKKGRIILNTLVAGLVAHKVATIAAVTWTKILNSAFAVRLKALKSQVTWTNFATAATKALSNALKVTPVGIIAFLASVTAGILGLTSASDEAKEKTDAWTEASKEAAKQYGEQKGKIESLVMVAENENLSLQRRKKAIAELNKIIPGYNAKIDETTGKYTASRKALDEYLNTLEKEMRYKANMDKMQELVAAAEEARNALDEAQIKAWSVPKERLDFWGFRRVSDEWIEVNRLKKEYGEREGELADFKRRLDDAMSKGVIVPPAADEGEELNEALENTNETASDTVNRLKEINAELKRLRKMDPQSDEELDRIQKRIELLKEEKEALLGKNKAKHEVGTYREDSIDEVSAPIDDAHQKRLLEINTSNQTKAEKTIAKNRELIRYCDELTKALDELRKKTDPTHTRTLDAINAEQNKLAAKAAEAQGAINKTKMEQDAATHAAMLKAQDAFYKTQSNLIKFSVSDNAELEEASSIYLLELDRQVHAGRLKELQEYYDKVEKADYYGAEEKANVLAKIRADISKVNSQMLTDTGKFQEKLREAMADTTSADGIKNGFESQRRAMELYYSALEATLLDDEKADADAIVALEAEKQRRIAALNYQYQEQVWRLQELTGLSWDQEYERELQQLENYHTQGLIKERDYQKAKLQLGVNNAKKYFDYYSQLSGSMFSAIQDAEIARSDAKFDVLIQQAKNNGEDTAALEEEKENKKLEIQKKYADVNFAIKVSQIIADTAVSIMKVFADLGPLGGAIAAAMLTATGAAQVVQAKAERDKVKNMQPGSTAGSSEQAPAKAERVLSGYSDGGYTGDGGRYEVAGVVHRGEYVVPKPIMDNPRVVDAVGTIEAIRRHRIPAGGTASAVPVAGYSDGGFTGAPVAGVDNAELTAAVKELRGAVKNIRAYVVLKDIERANETMERARAPFTRKR